MAAEVTKPSLEEAYDIAPQASLNIASNQSSFTRHQRGRCNCWPMLLYAPETRSFVRCLLGQSGGRDTDKASRSAGEAFPWESHQPSCQVLSVPQSVALVPECSSYMTLHMVNKQVCKVPVGSRFLRRIACERPT